MKHCNHPKLVRLYAVCTTKDPYYIITEYMINGSLLHFLRKDQNLPIQALVDMSAQVNYFKKIFRKFIFFKCLMTVEIFFLI